MIAIVAIVNVEDARITCGVDGEVARAGAVDGYGTGNGQLTRTVSSATPSKTEFTFSFNGTDLGYKTTFYMYDAILGLYADDGGTWSFGHSWWRITTDSYIREFINMEIRLFQ